MNLTTHLYQVPGDDVQKEGCVGFTFTVKLAAESEGCASVWN